MTPRRVVSIAHSYSVVANRRLAHEIARQGGSGWEVTAVAPSFIWGDLRPIPLERSGNERCELIEVIAHLTRHAHVLFYARELREILRRKWDVVHCWEEPYVFAASQVAWWTSSSARLVYATCQNISKAYPPPFNLMERYAMRRADGWIAFGRSVYDSMMTRPHYPTRQGRIIPLGVDIEAFKSDPARRDRTRRELGWSDGDTPVVGFLGRFVPEKGLRLLMRCLDTVRCPWRALFSGGGPLESELRRWAAGHGDRVRIMTGVGHDQVPAVLNAMDILCAPSQTIPSWREQFGRMLIEAFACGVPVIGSDSGEIPHVLGDAGIVVSERDAGAWVNALECTLDDPALRIDLAVRGLGRARAKYAWPVVARQHLEFFAELMESPRSAR